MTDFKELREALDAYENWLADGAPVVDPDDTYPDDLYLAATRPAPIRSLLAELDAARRDAERWRTTRLLARYTGDGGDWLDLGRLPWPQTGHATTPDYADAAIDAMKEQQP